MPFFNEPISPRYNPERKTDATAQKWLDKLAEFEAYVFVTPEYNHSVPGPLKNALDYVGLSVGPQAGGGRLARFGRRALGQKSL